MYVCVCVLDLPPQYPRRGLAADLSADTKAELQRAADYLNGSLDLKFANGIAINSWKQGAEINEGLNLEDGALINALQNRYTKQQITRPHNGGSLPAGAIAPRA